MSRTWNTTDELLDLIAREAKAGRHVRLSPQTALSLVNTARAAEQFMRPPGGPLDRFRIDLYKEGSCIYRLWDSGDIERVEAWARNGLVARATLAAIEKQYPRVQFEQRRRAWVEGRTGPNPPAS